MNPEDMNECYGDKVVSCSKCDEWSGPLKEAYIAETANGNGVNWTCPECEKLVGTTNY